MPRRGPELTPQMRGRILQLHSLRYSCRAIAELHQLPKSTVHYTIRKERERNEKQESLPRPGAPRVILEEQRDRIYDTVTMNPAITYEALQYQEAPEASVRTIRKLLHDMNIRKWACLKRLALTADHAQQRLIWANQYFHFTYLNWRRIRWGDECSIQLGKGLKFGWVFVTSKKDRLRPDMIAPKRCGQQKSKMFWAAFGYGIRTQLVPMNGDPDSARGGITARVYQEVLSTYLRPILYLHDIFMHDGASIHTAHLIRDWLLEHRIEVMDWPPYSLDLNPIENVWALLKAEIYRRCPYLIDAPNTIATLEILINVAIATWDSMGVELLNRFLDTMH
jgi:transposase